MAYYLAATKVTQGRRKSDFFNGCKEGDMVHFSQLCDGGSRNLDGRCGCGRLMQTFDGCKTTTIKVVNDPNLTRRALRTKLTKNLKKYYRKVFGDLIEEDEISQYAKEESEELVNHAEHFARNGVTEEFHRYIEFRTPTLQERTHRISR